MSSEFHLSLLLISYVRLNRGNSVVDKETRVKNGMKSDQRQIRNMTRHKGDGTHLEMITRPLFGGGMRQAARVVLGVAMFGFSNVVFYKFLVVSTLSNV